MLRTRRPLLALLLLGVLLAGGYLLSAVRTDDPGPSGSASTGPTVTAGPTVRPTATTGADGLPTVRTANLPVQARQVLQLIDSGGPFPYSQDGTVFGNVERLLPSHARGWYHEYTVPTPGSRDRGARRIIAGQDGARYYTADHYESFARVVDP
ncbi:MAG TPA: ribonuclease domain-containing protein [Mycobacteriales bacterium]|nr:ribonuclease domain-containing protein [Mycobacteriales bacterium]